MTFPIPCRETGEMGEDPKGGSFTPLHTHTLHPGNHVLQTMSR